jgi:SAM-dependent methyltransferase
MKNQGDPIGKSILDFAATKVEKDIVVQCDISEDDVIPVSYLFRSYEQMPNLEKFALSQVDGKVLDVGAGAGCHTKHLIQEGFKVKAIEISKGACEHLRAQGLDVINTDILSHNKETYDTILLLMNGIGLAGSVEELPIFLNHLKTLLNPGGKILCDSSDISYMYENEDGSIWIDLNSNYYGEIRYNMVYEHEESGWFDWLFCDPLRLKSATEQAGLNFELIFDGENKHYLAELKNN